jgi:hypothetical protein
VHIKKYRICEGSSLDGKYDVRILEIYSLWEILREENIVYGKHPLTRNPKANPNGVTYLIV